MTTSQNQDNSQKPNTVNTDGGAFIGGNANVSGDMISRDQNVQGDYVRGDVHHHHHYPAQPDAPTDAPTDAISSANQSMTSNQPSQIFISYSWGGNSEKLVNLIDKTFQARGVTIIRDKNEMTYKGSIMDFMRQLGQGRCVIVVIGKEYLTSKNCMFELMEIAKHGEFVERIFPVVLSDAGIYDAANRIQYIKHWETKSSELNEAMKGVDSLANLQGVSEDLNLYTEIRATIARLMDILADMNALSPQQHQDSNFAALFDAINAVLEKDASAQPQATTAGGTGSQPSGSTDTFINPSAIDRNQLVEKLLAIPTIQDNATRNDVISELPDNIRNNIQRRSNLRPDVMNLARTCLNYPGGVDSLFGVLGTYEGDSNPLLELKSFLSL